MRHTAFALFIVLAACGAPDDAPPEDEGTPETSVELVDETTAESDATEAAKSDATGLTAAQARQVLELLDSTCGDTWCEGDFNWQFKKIVCTFGQKRCTLTMLIDDREDLSVWRSARITNVSSFATLVRNGELRPGFYDKVNRAISLIEDALHDTDGDGVLVWDDNCPDVANASQADRDGNGVGDACE